MGFQQVGGLLSLQRVCFGLAGLAVTLSLLGVWVPSSIGEGHLQWWRTFSGRGLGISCMLAVDGNTWRSFVAKC